MSEYSCVLDASAILAMLHEEPGGKEVEPHLAQAAVSSVNWSEVAQKSLSRGVGIESLREDLEALGLTILPFDAEDGEATAKLRERTKEHGLSLADWACLALAEKLSVEALTTDRVWKGIGGASVRVIR